MSRRPLFGSFLHALQLIFPETLERLRPFIHRPDCFRIKAIEHVPPLPPHQHKSYIPQYPQVLGASTVTRAHLAGFTWGAEDLSAALGASGKRDRTGALTFTFELARAHCLLAAAALDVPAVDGVHTEFRDTAALQRELEDARRDGFGGKLAIHPDQVAPINAAFSPTEAEREHARRVLAAFAAAGNSGVASLDGQMIDRPHLLQAQRILAAPKD